MSSGASQVLELEGLLLPNHPSLAEGQRLTSMSDIAPSLPAHHPNRVKRLNSPENLLSHAPQVTEHCFSKTREAQGRDGWVSHPFYHGHKWWFPLA